jgi:hypothetical protein
LFDKPPAHVEAAIRGAYPLPETFAAARAEFSYWRERRHEMEDLLEGHFGDSGLDMVAELRMDIVERLIERDLPVKSPADLLERFRLYRAREWSNVDTEKQLFDDLERIVERAAHPSSAMDT